MTSHAVHRALLKNINSKIPFELERTAQLCDPKMSTHAYYYYNYLLLLLSLLLLLLPMFSLFSTSKFTARTSLGLAAISFCSS
jgi:hypothetical protein